MQADARIQTHLQAGTHAGRLTQVDTRGQTHMQADIICIQIQTQADTHAGRQIFRQNTHAGRHT